MSSEYEISLGEIAATLAHEVRNPLALVLANINMLELDCKSPAAGVRFGLIKRELAKIGDMCHELINISAPIGDEGESEIAVLLRDITAPFIAAYTGEIEFEINTEGEISIPIPPKVFRITINNILKNAVEAIKARRPKQGKISITAKKEEKRAVITIKDNGIGMDKDTMEHALKPGFTTKHGQGGSGIGLYAAKTLLARYGGELVLSSGQGCCINIQLPIENLR